MLENFLLQIGMKCGTVKNFSNTIVEDIRTFSKQHWYFLTPIKITENKVSLKECTVNFAFPFLVEKGDISEAIVLKRLNEKMTSYESSLLLNLRKMVMVPTYSTSLIPFWANEKGERNGLKNLGQGGIHIINVQATIKYRETWFNCWC